MVPYMPEVVAAKHKELLREAARQRQCAQVRGKRTGLRRLLTRAS